MSWGPGSPLGWAGFLVGRGMAWRCWLGVGGWGGEARQKGTSLPKTKEVGRGVPGRKTQKLSLSEPARPWGVPAGLGSLCFLRGHREGPQYSARTLNGLIVC